MLIRAIPVFHVSDSRAAKRFFADGLGFTLEFAYRPDANHDDPCYMGFLRDNVRIHASTFSGDGVVGGVANLLVEDIDALHAELRDRGLPIALEPTDQTWGSRELYVEDDDGNSIRFVQA